MADANAIYKRVLGKWLDQEHKLSAEVGEDANFTAYATIMAACIIAEAIRNSTGEDQ